MNFLKKMDQAFYIMCHVISYACLSLIFLAFVVGLCVAFINLWGLVFS